MGKFIRRLAIIGAAIGGVVFFWRKRQHRHDPGTTGGPASASRP